MIIGITGTLGAGKGTLVEFLVKDYGFKHFSVRDFLIEEINRRGMPVTRDSMVIVGNDLRQNFGPDFIVQSLYSKAQATGGNAIIESIRAVKEAETIKALGGVIFAVDAEPKLRFDRIIKRGTVTDNITFEKFIEDEAKEMTSVDDTKQNIRGVMNMADYTFINDGDIEAFQDHVRKVLEVKFNL